MVTKRWRRVHGRWELEARRGTQTSLDNTVETCEETSINNKKLYQYSAYDKTISVCSWFSMWTYLSLFWICSCCVFFVGVSSFYINNKKLYQYPAYDKTISPFMIVDVDTFVSVLKMLLLCFFGVCSGLSKEIVLVTFFFSNYSFSMYLPHIYRTSRPHLIHTCPNSIPFMLSL